MFNFLLGISLTLNLVCVVSIFMILKIFILGNDNKEKKKEKKLGVNEDAIVDKNTLKDFWS